jgi:DNA polymerase
MLEECTNLEQLWSYVNEVNEKHFPENNLMPILGNGKTDRPKVMFVFINPTIRNISSDRSWKGPRFPFIGTKQVWRVFHKAGLFDGGLLDEINTNSSWSIDFTNKVLQHLKGREFYFTNIVKWTGHDAALPEKEKIKLFLPLLKKEIEIVKPLYIVAFGLIPFENISGRKIKLSGYYKAVIKDQKLKAYSLRVNAFETKIIPCYFPIGRGNPKAAVGLLKLIEKL